MIFVYGNYAHDDGEVELRIQKRPVFNARGFRHGIVETWNIKGVLQADTQAELGAKINALVDAYKHDDKSAGLHLAEGAGSTSHQLPTGTAEGGVRVVAGPSFPVGSGPQYAAGAAGRDYTIRLQAFYPELLTNLLSYQETISAKGSGGPRFVVLEVLNGPPVKQQVASKTPVSLTQIGNAVGHLSYPVPPPPIWAVSLEHEELRSIVKRSKRRSRNDFYEYPISWQYTFESPTSPGFIPDPNMQ